MNAVFVTQSCVLLFFCILPEAFSIKCFQCNSELSPECESLKANQTDSVHFQECKENHEGMFCRKMRITLIDKNREHKRIIRSCGWEQFQNVEKGTAYCKKRDTDFKMETICQCFTEGCNSGFVSKLSFCSLLPLVAIFIKELYFRN